MKNKPRVITVVNGDGISDEIMKVTLSAIEATGLNVRWEHVYAGARAIEEYGEPLPKHILQSIKKNEIAIKGPIETPSSGGFKSVNVALRKALNLYACVRPCKYYRGVPTRILNPGKIDILIFRENLEDSYAGIEFPVGEANTLKLIKFIEKLSGDKIRKDSGITIKSISKYRTKRITNFAYEYAHKLGRKNFTVGTKSNILKYTDGLFRTISEKESQRLIKKYPEMSHKHLIIDNASAVAVRWPESLENLLLPNLYGDMFSDLCAALVGGLGFAPGANIGDKYAVFEATHGTAPDIAGKNIVNPIAEILSGVMMLRYIGEDKRAQLLEDAVASLLAEGEYVTKDINPDAYVTTSEMHKALLRKIDRLVETGKYI